MLRVAGSNREHRVKHVIPDLARDTEAQLEVLVMVREMVLLHLLHVRGQARVMQTARNQYLDGATAQAGLTRNASDHRQYLQTAVRTIRFTNSTRNSQNVYAPAMVPLATEAGNTTCARLTKGKESAAKRAGGITSLIL